MHFYLSRSLISRYCCPPRFMLMPMPLNLTSLACTLVCVAHAYVCARPHTHVSANSAGVRNRVQRGLLGKYTSGSIIYRGYYIYKRDTATRVIVTSRSLFDNNYQPSLHLVSEGARCRAPRVRGADGKLLCILLSSSPYFCIPRSLHKSVVQCILFYNVKRVNGTPSFCAALPPSSLPSAAVSAAG